MNQSSYLPRDLIERYRCSATTRGGEVVDDYVDLRAALLDQFDRTTVVLWFRSQLADHMRDTIIGTGSFGAALCALLSQTGFQAVIYNPKGYGVEWSGRFVAKRAVFVDDVVTTGTTIAEVQAAAAEEGLAVVRTIVGWDRRLD